MAVPDERIARPRVEEQADLRLAHHLRERELRLLRVVRDGVADAVRTLSPDEAPALVALDERGVGGVPLLARRRDGGAAALQSIGELLTETADDGMPRAVVERQKKDDETARREPAELPVTLDEHDVRT